MSDTKEKTTFSDRTARFIEKYRFVLLGLFAAIAVGIAALLVITLIQGGMRESSAKMMDAIREKYDLYQLETDEAKKIALEVDIGASIDELVGKYPNLIAAQEALILKAEIAADKEAYKEAQEAYLSAYTTGKRSFIAPFALKYAASMAEKGGEKDKAIEYYETLVGQYEKKIPGIGLCYFELGRLYEESKNYAKASEIFAKLGELFPSDSWTNFAKSRIIYMKTQGLVP